MSPLIDSLSEYSIIKVISQVLYINIHYINFDNIENNSNLILVFIIVSF